MGNIAVHSAQYELYSNHHEKQMFMRYSCKITRRDYKNYHYFDGTIEESRVEQTRRLGAACCYHWIQSALEGEPVTCYGNDMKKVKYGEEAWVYNQETPRVLQVAWTYQ